MKFCIENIVGNDKRAICQYDKSEFSLLMDETCANGSLAINGLYVTMDFDIVTKHIMGVSGFVGDIKKIKKYQ